MPSQSSQNSKTLGRFFERLYIHGKVYPDKDKGMETESPEERKYVDGAGKREAHGQELKMKECGEQTVAFGLFVFGIVCISRNHRADQITPDKC